MCVCPASFLQLVQTFDEAELRKAAPGNSDGDVLRAEHPARKCH